jgi:hypothetical protein
MHLGGLFFFWLIEEDCCVVFVEDSATVVVEGKIERKRDAFIRADVNETCEN